MAFHINLQFRLELLLLFNINIKYIFTYLLTYLRVLPIDNSYYYYIRCILICNIIIINKAIVH